MFKPAILSLLVQSLYHVSQTLTLVCFCCTLYRKHWRWRKASLKHCRVGSRWMWRKLKDCSSGSWKVSVLNRRTCNVKYCGTCMLSDSTLLFCLHSMNAHLGVLVQEDKKFLILLEISGGLPASSSSLYQIVKSCKILFVDFVLHLSYVWFSLCVFFSIRSFHYMLPSCSL